MTASHPTIRRSAKRSVALVTAGGACVLSSLLPALGEPAAAADAEPGSGLGSFSLSASSPAYQVRQQEPNYCFGTAAGLNGCELVVPEAVATLRNGPVGLGLAAIVWPGSLAANLGSLLITASDGKIPDEARMLNDPVKAEARTSTGPDTVVYDDVPGTTMKAVAKDDQTSAEADVSQVTDPPVGTFGKSSGRSTTALKGSSFAEATARSSVKDVDLAAGVVHIGSVTSEARATTDGKAATATGKTLVTGVTIAGVPVTIDENGVKVNGTGLPASTATAAVNAALANANISIAVSEPQGKPDGASVTYSAGSLVVLWKPTPGNTTTVVLGGANVSVRATKAFDFSTGIVDTPGTIDPFVPSTDPAVPTGTGSVGGPVTGGIDTPAPDVPGAPAPNVSKPVLAAGKVPLVDGLSPALGLLGLLGSGLIAAGLKRLPDRVLVASAPVCLLEETA